MNEDVSINEISLGSDATGMRLDRALAIAIPTVSRERLKALISSGHVSNADGQLLRDPARKATAGQFLRVAIPIPPPAQAVAQNIPIDIIYEDRDLLIVDKPAGLVVHPACGNLDGTLVNALLYHCAERLSGIGGSARPGIVHRIDKDTSGLLVVAKTDPAHEALAAQFARRHIERRYKAIVAGMPMPPTGTVNASLGRSPSDRKKMAVVSPDHGKSAITHYRVLESLKNAALVECQLETGRTHQVRVHMTSIGHPLLGDPVYGRTRSVHQSILQQLKFQRQALHAAYLGFNHPITGEKMAFESQMPQDMQELFSSLRV